MKKKLLAMIIAATMAFTLFGCGGQPSADDNNAAGGAGSAADGADTADGGKIKVGLALDKRDQFTTSLESAVTAKAEELGADLHVVEANKDFATQLSHVQTFAVDGFDAVIVKLINTDGAQEIINAAGSMPVVFVNMKPDESLLEQGKNIYVGSDEHLAGGLQAQYVANYAKAQGLDTVRAVILTGELGQDPTVIRTQSFKDSLTGEYGLGLDVVYEDTAEWDRAKAMDKFVQFMGSGKGYDVVVCNNDDMALGVVEAMKTSGDKKVVCPVLGVDATNIGCQSIKDGELAFTVYQSAKGQGAAAIESAISLVKGESLPKIDKGTVNDDQTIIWIDFEPVDKDNVDQYMG
ncbi:substrate-binding domain-containing protein [Intestinibacillus massiliensis]|nr:substrate-binding domain-containing protein [Intestinibacillus massiliensis]